VRRGAAGRAASTLVPIRAEGDRPPFFCIHPAGGDVSCYADLARELGPGQPFYGLVARGLRAGEEILTRFDDIVEHALAAVLAVDPAGPYRLGGWSFGGFVAYEMARRLRERGKEVALLALFDPNIDAVDALALKPFDDVDLILKRFDFLGLTAGELRAVEPAGRLAYALRTARERGALPEAFDDATAERFFEVYRANAMALQQQRMGTYAGRATLFRARERVRPVSHALLGWEGLVAGGIEVVDVPGYHDNMMSRPQVETVARELRACLDRALVADASREDAESEPETADVDTPASVV
jgi:thioesterase domain-containing protein